MNQNLTEEEIEAIQKSFHELVEKGRTETQVSFMIAIRRLVEELKKDTSEGSYYYTWQANIAMAFYDEFIRQRCDSEESSEDIHRIANQAAKNFLNQLIRE